MIISPEWANGQRGRSPGVTSRHFCPPSIPEPEIANGDGEPGYFTAFVVF
jgi:hypothetical protein